MLLELQHQRQLAFVQYLFPGCSRCFSILRHTRHLVFFISFFAHSSVHGAHIVKMIDETSAYSILVICFAGFNWVKML